jgi:hypothetical protein
MIKKFICKRAVLHLYLLICCLEHLFHFCIFYCFNFSVFISTFFVRSLAPLVAWSGSGSCMWTVGRVLRTPGLDVKAEESSGQVLSTSVARTCTEVFIRTINRKPPGAAGLCPLVSTFITSIHYEHVYFYQVRSAAICCKPTFHTRGCRRNSCTCPHLTLPTTGN